MAYRDRIQGYGNVEPEPELGLRGAQQLSEQVIHYAGEIGTAVIAGVEKGVTVMREQGITEAASNAYTNVVTWIGTNMKGTKPEYSQQSYPSYNGGSTAPSSFSTSAPNPPRTANRWGSKGYGPGTQTPPLAQTSEAPPVLRVSSSSSSVPARRDSAYERGVIESMCIPVGARLQPPDAVMDEFSRKVEHFDGAAVGAIFAELLSKAPSIQHKMRVVYVMDGLWKNGVDIPVFQAVDISKDILQNLSQAPQSRGKINAILQAWGLAVQDHSVSSNSPTSAVNQPQTDLMSLDYPPATNTASRPQVSGLDDLLL